MIMTEDDKVSVIMHTYYRYDCLETVLRGLSQQSLKPYEVIITDQTPLADRPDGFYEKFTDLPLKIINLNNPSHAPAQNAGAKVSSGDLLLFLDDDMEFGDDLVEAYVHVLHEEHVDVIFGAVSSEKSLPLEVKRDYRRLDPLSYFLKSQKCKWSGMVLITHGGNTLIKREQFFSINGYDEKIPRMSDIELGYRLFLHGAKMYYSEKPFCHHKKWGSGGTRKTNSDTPYVRLLSRIYLYKKHFPGWSTKQFILKEIISALLFRQFVSGQFTVGYLLRPYSVFFRLWQLIKANSTANRLLSN